MCTWMYIHSDGQVDMRVIQTKILTFFSNNLLIQKCHITASYHQHYMTLKSTSSRKMHGFLYLLVECTTTHELLVVPPLLTQNSFHQLPLWMLQRCGNHFGWGMTDVEDTQSAGLLWFLLVNGWYGVEHCHVARRWPGHSFCCLNLITGWRWYFRMCCTCDNEFQ